jgi:hypothetical protein
MKLIKEDLDERHYWICYQTGELVHNEKICKSVNCNPGHVYEIVYEQFRPDLYDSLLPTIINMSIRATIRNQR